MIKFLVTIAIGFFCLGIQAQQTPEDMIKTFFKEYETNPGQAVDNIYNTNSWNSRIGDGIAKIKSSIEALTPGYVGKCYGHELILKKEVSNFLSLYSYAVKYDREPIRFTFLFYKANDKCVLYSFKYDTDIDDELETSAKLNYTNIIH